ncbi:MAG: PP0621 family protein [Nitrosomonadales bacterium]
MSRLFFFAVIAAVVYWLLKSYRQQLPGDQNTSTEAEDMVRCVHCGVHLPKHEAIVANDDYFCSEAHRLAHSNKPE